MKYLYFSAAWCAPCKTLAPIMNEVSSEVPVNKIDIDSQSELAIKYNVRNIPTVILVNGDVEIKTICGCTIKEYLFRCTKINLDI